MNTHSILSKDKLRTKNCIPHIWETWEFSELRYKKLLHNTHGEKRWRTVPRALRGGGLHSPESISTRVTACFILLLVLAESPLNLNWPYKKNVIANFLTRVQ